MAAPPRLRVGLVQFTPKHGDIPANIATAQALVDGVVPGSLDLLCFPEMAFTAYAFPTSSSILPLLEKDSGPTSAFLASVSRKLHCYTAAGLPIALSPSERPAPRPADPSAPPDDIYGRHIASYPVGANAAIVVRPDGSIAATHRKRTLFRADVPWAAPGHKFTTFDLPPPLGRTTLAICMDLNNFVGNDVLRDFELATHCIEQGTKTLILLNAWLASPEEPDMEDDELEEDHDWHTIRYWAWRLKPLYSARDRGPDEIVVVICNRTGTENGLTFAGSSSVFVCKRGAGRAKLLDAMGRDEQDLRIVSISD